MEEYRTGNFVIRLTYTEYGVYAHIEENGVEIATLYKPDYVTAKRYANDFLNKYLDSLKYKR